MVPSATETATRSGAATPTKTAAGAGTTTGSGGGAVDVDGVNIGDGGDESGSGATGNNVGSGGSSSGSSGSGGTGAAGNVGSGASSASSANSAGSGKEPQTITVALAAVAGVLLLTFLGLLYAYRRHQSNKNELHRPIKSINKTPSPAEGPSNAFVSPLAAKVKGPAPAKSAPLGMGIHSLKKPHSGTRMANLLPSSSLVQQTTANPLALSSYRSQTLRRPGAEAAASIPARLPPRTCSASSSRRTNVAVALQGLMGRFSVASRPSSLPMADVDQGEPDQGEPDPPEEEQRQEEEAFVEDEHDKEAKEMSFEATTVLSLDRQQRASRVTLAMTAASRKSTATVAVFAPLASSTESGEELPEDSAFTPAADNTEYR